jgi:hypothetical protein
MPIKRIRKTKTLSVKAAELAVAVPQVVAHRVTRMVLAGAVPSARDQQEFQRMSAEKTEAFNESWAAMAAQAVRANQDLTATLMKSFWSPLAAGKPSAAATARQMQAAALSVLSKGMAPVHRRAVANAKRLGKIKLR